MAGSRPGSRIVSLCTGTFAATAAGLLDGRRATTHWPECAGFAHLYPKVTAGPGVLSVGEGDILTNAGSAAGIGLCLHVVRTDYGTEIATQPARQLVAPPQHDGGQAQYIDAPMEQTASPLRPTCASTLAGPCTPARRHTGALWRTGRPAEPHKAPADAE